MDSLIDVLRLVIQGATGGLIVFVFSDQMQKRKKKLLLQKVSDALVVEMEAHIALWDTILEGDSILAEDIAALKEHSFWNKNLETIEGMNIAHFRIVSFYFRAAFQVLQRISVRNFPRYKIQTMRLTAEQALYCFELYAANTSADRAIAAERIRSLELQLREIDDMRPKE